MLTVQGLYVEGKSITTAITSMLGTTYNDKLSLYDHSYIYKHY